MVKIRVKCDFCDELAVYDTQTKMGPWAYVCQKHFDKYSTKIEGLFTALEQPVAPTTKKCVICGKEMTLDNFYRYVDKAGVERYRNDCKMCHLAERKRVSFRR